MIAGERGDVGDREAAIGLVLPRVRARTEPLAVQVRAHSLQHLRRALARGGALRAARGRRHRDRVPRDMGVLGVVERRCHTGQRAGRRGDPEGGKDVASPHRPVPAALETGAGGRPRRAAARSSARSHISM